MAVVSNHKMQFKKSKPVKIGQNWSKYAIIYSKLAIFSWKRQQVDMFLATFVDHAIHCWNPQVLEISFLKSKNLPILRKNGVKPIRSCLAVSFPNRGSTSDVFCKAKLSGRFRACVTIPIWSHFHNSKCRFLPAWTVSPSTSWPSVRMPIRQSKRHKVCLIMLTTDTW